MGSLENKIAVLLNTNAKRVTKGIIRKIKRGYGEKVKIYETSSLEQLKEVVKEIIENKYALICPGGGDGTWFNLWNELKKQASYFPEHYNPSFALLKLGTGNSMSPLIGSKEPLQQLELILKNKDFRKLPCREFPLIEITITNKKGYVQKPVYATFAGSGIDGEVLNHYKELKGIFKEGLLGYLRAGFTKTLPYELRKNPFSGVSIILDNNKIYRIGEFSRPDIEKVNIEQGEDLLKNVHPINAILVGTTPFYGFGFTTFPFARFANINGNRMMHLRVISGNPKITALSLATNIKSVWQGLYKNNNILEYLTEKITIEYWGGEEEVPLQISGDAQGSANKISYKISPYNLQLVNFRKLV